MSLWKDVVTQCKHFSAFFLEVTRIWALGLLISYVVKRKLDLALRLPFGVYALMDSFFHLANI